MYYTLIILMGITESHFLEEKYYGFRIYKLNPLGPLAKAGLKELEDFIIPPAEVLENKMPFYEYVKVNANKCIKFSIYSTAKRCFNIIDVTPNNTWGSATDGYLGASVRYENWSTSHSNLLRVLSVKPGSNAEKMKLVPMEDYIVALRPENKDIITLNNDNIDPLTLFMKIINDNIGNNVEFFIYNCKTGCKFEKIKLIGEQEIMGCDVAYGKLHNFPKLVEIGDIRQDSVENLDGEKENLDSEVVNLDRGTPEKVVVDGSAEKVEAIVVASNIKVENIVDDSSEKKEETVDDSSEKVEEIVNSSAEKVEDASTEKVEEIVVLDENKN